MATPCIAIIRFDQERAIAYRNCIKRNGRIIRTFGGQDLFMSDQAVVFEGQKRRDRGAGVLYFGDISSTEKWMDSDTEIRQQDWLGGMADVIAAPLLKMPVPNEPAFVVLDLEIREEAQFFDKYLRSLVAALERTRARLLVATLKKKTLKGSWQPQFVVVQQWPSLHEFDQWYESEEGKRVQELRLRCADCYAFKFEQYFQ